MTVTERDRRNIYTKLAESIGEEEANNLMQLLPPHPATELATRDDVLSMASTLRGEMAELRGDLRSEMAELRGEVSELRTELKSEMAELRAEAKSDMAELRVEVTRQIATLKRWAGGIVAANGVAVVTALLV